MAAAKKLNVAVIGCGVIAPTHIESYQMIPGVKVKWLCDLVPAKAKKLAEKYGVDYVSTDLKEVLLDPELDAVSICTDHADHAPSVIAALKAGKHVLCEKALSSSFEGLAKMLAEGKKHPKQVFGGVFQHRFDGVYPYLRKLIADGAFGKMLTANLQVACLRTDAYYKADKWRGTWAQEGGSVLINQAIHFVDLLGWMMGGVESVSASYANLGHKKTIETEDTATASLIFKSGALGSISATSASHIEWESTFTLFGTEGSVDVRTGVVTRIAFKDAKLQKAVEKAISKIKDADHKAGKAYYGPSHPALILDFVKAVRGEKPYFIPACEAAPAVDLVLSIYKSHDEGKRVKLKAR